MIPNQNLLLTEHMLKTGNMMNQGQMHDPFPGYNLEDIPDPSLENDPQKDLPIET